jgi:alkylhydroperoxidase family enzyme
MPRIEPIPWDKLPAKQREMIEAGVKSGAFTDPMPVQILAYADHDAAPDDGDRHPNFPRHLLGAKLMELLRIRSAQLGGCEPCSASRKVEGSAEAAVCLTNPALRGDLTERERLALEFLELLANDHHSIGDDQFRRLSEHFTTAEIVELGLSCASMMGTHRFMHTLNLWGDEPPVIPYDPDQVGVASSQRPAARTANAA